MKTKTTFYHYIWVLSIMLLVCACAPRATDMFPTQTIDATSVYQNAFATALAKINQTAAPTHTPTPTSTKIPTITRTPLPLVVLDGLRVVYSNKGNIYIQDSGDKSVQLTHENQNSLPVLSSDGQKVVFSHTPPHKPYQLYSIHELYSIDADGSHERPLVTSNLLAALHLGYGAATEPCGGWMIVKDTHLLLFSTCEFHDGETMCSACQHNNDLLLANIDSGAIKSLFAHKKVKDYTLTPDGKNILILTDDNQINLIDLNGKLRQHIRDYIPVPPNSSFVTPDWYWTNDLNTLNIALPPLHDYMDYAGPELRTSIWQYPLKKGGAGIEIHFSPPLINSDFKISPDGNWIVYTYYYVDGKNDNESEDKFGVYLGNLRNGSSQLLDLPGLDKDASLPDCSFFWAPDSLHFIFEDEFRGQLYLGDVDRHIAPLAHRVFASILWIDNKRYLYDNAIMGEIGKDEIVRVADVPRDPQQMDTVSFVFLNDH